MATLLVSTLDPNSSWTPALPSSALAWAPWNLGASFRKGLRNLRHLGPGGLWP